MLPFSRHFLLRLIAVCGVTVLGHSAAMAQPVVTVPTDLLPGQQYRLAFVTSGIRDATSNDIGIYNDFVDGFGETVIAGHDWRAIASTGSVNARVNTATDSVGGVPIYRLNDTRIANDYDHLWNGGLNLLAPLNITETGALASTPGARVYTGTSANGVTNLPLDGTSPILVGVYFTTNSAWMEGAAVAPDQEYGLYAISSILTVPTANVPEPGTFALAGMLASVVVLRQRKRRATSLPTDPVRS